MKTLFSDTYGKIITKHEEYIHCLGGDGTLLRAINKFSNLRLPFYGQASGTANFLMNKLDAPLAKSVTKSFRRIKVTVYSIMDPMFEYTEHHLYAFNDVILGGFNAWLNFETKHKDNQIGNFSGSAIVVSTAQGSTGLNRNNGGTILSLESDQWSVTGVCTKRNINTVISPSRLEINVEGRTDATLCIDGTNHELQGVYKIILSQEMIFK